MTNINNIIVDNKVHRYYIINCSILVKGSESKGINSMSSKFTNSQCCLRISSV